MRDVQVGWAQVLTVTLTVTRDHALFGGDGQAVAALASIGPGQEPVGCQSDLMLGELLEQAIERLLDIGMAPEGGQRIGIIEERVGPPR